MNNPTDNTAYREELRTKLASIEHERWADWQKYMHSLCSKLGDFDTDYALVIPSKSVTHWERQIKTPYAELSEREKASDMEQVDRYWPLVEQFITSERERAYRKGYNDNSRDCYCDSSGATEGVMPHRHLADDGKSHDIRPDIQRISPTNQSEEGESRE